MRWLLALLLLLLPAPAAAATFYVATTGSDAVSCLTAQTIGTPKQTIAAGLGCLAAGDTLYLRGGTYTSQRIFEVDFGATGTMGSPILVSGYLNEAVTITLTPGGDNLIRFQDGSITYVTIRNVTVDGIGGLTASEGAVAVYFAATSANLTLDTVEVKNSTGTGLLIEGTDLTLTNLNVHGNGTWSGYTNSNGLYFTGDTSIISGGTFYNNECFGVRVGNSSAVLSADGNLVRNVHTYTNGQGKGLGGTSTCTGGGGVVVGDVDNLVYNNLIYDNVYGLLVFPFGGKVPTDTLLYNNTITENTVGIEVQATSLDTLLTNNIVWNNGGNISNSGTGTIQTTNYTSNPLFVDAATHDYRIQLGSLTLNVGTTLAEVPVDILGVTRPQGSAYDIGAYERVPTGTPTVFNALLIGLQ